jgi:hypothetical protein
MQTMLTSKDKAKVLKWAKAIGRKVLWCDDFGMWHASINQNSVPNYATKKELVK